MRPIVTHRTPMNVLATRVQPAKDKLADLTRPATEVLLQFVRFFKRENHPSVDDGALPLQASAPSNES